jgi:hypothetical protein
MRRVISWYSIYKTRQAIDNQDQKQNGIRIFEEKQGSKFKNKKTLEQEGFQAEED